MNETHLLSCKLYSWQQEGETYASCDDFIVNFKFYFTVLLCAWMKGMQNKLSTHKLLYLTSDCVVFYDQKIPVSLLSLNLLFLHLHREMFLVKYKNAISTQTYLSMYTKQSFDTNAW